MLPCCAVGQQEYLIHFVCLMAGDGISWSSWCFFDNNNNNHNMAGVCFEFSMLDVRQTSAGLSGTLLVPSDFGMECTMGRRACMHACCECCTIFLDGETACVELWQLLQAAVMVSYLLLVCPADHCCVAESKCETATVRVRLLEEQG